MEKLYLYRIQNVFYISGGEHMDLSNVKKVEDLTLMSDANKRLEQGWILIGTYTNNYDPRTNPGGNTFHYVVGLPDGVGYVDTPQDTNYIPLEDLDG